MGLNRALKQAEIGMLKDWVGCHEEDSREMDSKYGVSALSVGFFVGKPATASRKSVSFQ